MVEVTYRDGLLRGTDPTGNAVTVEPRGWEPRDPPHAFDTRVTAARGGITAGVRFPGERLWVEALDDDVDVAALGDQGDGWTALGDAYLPNFGETLELPGGAYRFRTGNQPIAFLRVDAPATVVTGHAEAAVTFDSPTPVTVGFRSDDAYPDATVRVPETPAGVATAIETFPAALRTTTPDRSFPTLRGHPPLVEFGRTEVPDVVRERVPDVAVTFEVPPSVPDLFALAPLVAYVGGSVETADREAAVVRADGIDFPLPPAPAVAPAARRLLRRVVGLDCLVREAGEYGTGLAERDALPDGFADEWFDRSPAARLARYLDPDLDPVVTELPRPRYEVTLEPRVDYTAVLPYALNKLCAIRLPDEPADDAPPTGRYAIHGVVGDVEASETGREELTYASFPVAYEHGLRSRGDATRVVCASADPPEAAGDVREASTVYRQRAGGETTVRTETGVDRETLRGSLDDSATLLHYAGECDPDRGLRCADGWLDPDAVEVDAVVLDAPRSLTVGRRLVERGAVAAVCTAAAAPLSVDPALGGFFLDGISLAAATAIAADTGAVADRARVVGDGAFATAMDAVILSEIDDGADDPAPFRSTVEAFALHPGVVFRASRTRPRLAGTPVTVTTTPEQLREDFRDTASPLVYDGEVVWPEETDRLLYPFA